MALTYLPAAQANAAVKAMFSTATPTFTDWCSTTPGLTGANTIVGFTPKSTSWTAAVTGKTHNAATPTWTTAPACTIKYFAEFNNATKTIYLGGGATTATITVPAGSKVSVAVGGITIAVQG